MNAATILPAALSDRMPKSQNLHHSRVRHHSTNFTCPVSIINLTGFVTISICTLSAVLLTAPVVLAHTTPACPTPTTALSTHQPPALPNPAALHSPTPTSAVHSPELPPAAAGTDRPSTSLRPRARIDGDAKLTAPVGMFSAISQVFLPGTELIADAGSGPTAGLIVIRIDGVYPHGDGFRYDLTWSGQKPGDYDLAQWLRRRDGTSTADLPMLPVKVTSLLAPKRITPNELRPAAGGWVGGYRVLLGLLGFFWLAGLLALLWFRREAPQATSSQTSGRSRLDQIRAQLEAVVGREELSAADKASLESLILSFWREQRKLTALAPAALLQTLLADPQSGPLLRQLERWLYDRPQRTDASELADLLRPLQRLADEAADQPEGTGG